MGDDKKTYVRTPLFPLYPDVRQVLKVWQGVPRGDVRELLNAIHDQTGTPQNPVNWGNPDEWIKERLTGRAKGLAERIWAESQHTLNPRYTYGAYLFINNHGLMDKDEDGVLRVNERGERFLKSDADTVREIDVVEGLPMLLSILGSHSPAKRGDLISEWGEFLLEHSKFGTTSTIKDTMRRRMLNLVDRGFVSRSGNVYSITEKGLNYAARTDLPSAKKPHQDVVQAIKGYNEKQRETLLDRLATMDPYRFESVVKDLLEAMDYEDVVVTKQSGDMGIDVVANYQFGITQIKEVVQVKRTLKSVRRPVLDQLRGALPYHQAIRGCIITLGKFAKGCEEAALYPGAAPITLIDGERLMELIIKHGIAVKKRPLELIEVDESYFEGAPAVTDPAVTD